jgi:uncharacterized protein YjbI with pentapeptide repeats
MSLPAIAATLAVVGAFIVVAYVRRWGWTGFTTSSRDEATSAGPSTKKLWEWLDLFIIPLALVAIGVALNAAQSGREQHQEDARAAREQRQEDDRAALASAVAEDRARDDALLAYFRQMSELMLSEKLLRSERGDEVRTVAQTLTGTALRRLDGRQKGFVLQFLEQAGLIDRSDRGEATIIGLSFTSADLQGTILNDRSTLFTADLRFSDLQDADFRGARLYGIDFYGSNLRGADFRGAQLSKTDMKPVLLAGADLRGADFRGAFAEDTSFVDSCLTGARFNGAVMTSANFRQTHGYDVNFSDSSLGRANFRKAKLVDVQMHRADVGDTTFPNGWRPDGLALERKEVECEGGVLGLQGP